MCAQGAVYGGHKPAGTQILSLVASLIPLSERKTHSRPMKLVWDFRSLKAFPCEGEINVRCVLYVPSSQKRAWAEEIALPLLWGNGAVPTICDVRGSARVGREAEPGSI